ncbi:unnamed protein product [Boreogadus saida]
MGSIGVEQGGSFTLKTISSTMPPTVHNKLSPSCSERRGAVGPQAGPLLMSLSAPRSPPFPAQQLRKCQSHSLKAPLAPAA